MKSAEENAAIFEFDLAKGIVAGIEKSTFRLDAAGAVFLSPSWLPEGTA
jgi:hypothetical protein